MTRHRSLVSTPRQQEVRTRRSSHYHSPPRLSSVTNPVAAHCAITSATNRAVSDSTGTSDDLPPPRRRKQVGRGLNESTQQRLLKDIKVNGGLQVFSLANLVKEKPDDYGGVLVDGSQDKELHRQVQNCVKEWKKLTDARYLLLLNHYGVRAVSLQSSFFIPDQQPIGVAAPLMPLISILPQPPIIESSSAIDQVSTLPSIATPTFTSPPRSNRYSAMNSNTALVVRKAPGASNDEVEGTFL